jgi:hypothetical protein
MCGGRAWPRGNIVGDASADASRPLGTTDMDDRTKFCMHNRLANAAPPPKLTTFRAQKGLPAVAPAL